VEPTGLIPDAPAKRLADIMIRLSPPAKQTNQPVAKLQLLDIAMLPHPPSLTAPPHGLDKRLINLKTLVFFADRSHIASMKEKCQGKTTTSATQIDTIATITEPNYASFHSQSTNWDDSDALHMNPLECRKLHSHQQNRLGTKQLICLEQTNLLTKHTHSHQIHHNICYTASTP
jgi:hypothetical protein